ncbi:hypothetical protein [Arthrobacter crystallopoietes]|nr:hypothetical protein [Arthrobacter crystallopoietes]
MVFDDHVETWSSAVGQQQRNERRRAGLKYFGIPTALALPFLFVHFRLQGIAQLLSGVTIFTALLFGLLVLMFNTGIAVRKDSAIFEHAHDLKLVISDLRANVTYAAVVAVCLSLLLAIAAAITSPPSTVDPVGGLSWWWTPICIWFFTHLGLTLLMILRRLRTAFNYVSR